MLHTNPFVFQVFCLFDRGVFRDNDDLFRFNIREGEIDLPFPVLRNSNTGCRDIRLARHDSGDHRVEAHILNDQLFSDLLRDSLHEIDINSDDPAAFAEFVRRKRRLRDHNDFIGPVRPAGTEQEHHCKNGKSRKNSG